MMSESGLLEVDVVVKDVGAEGDENVEGLMDDGKDKDVEEKEKEKEEEARKKGVQSQTGERHLMPSVGVPIMPAVMPDGSHMVGDPSGMHKGMVNVSFGGPKMDMDDERKGKRRRIYQTDEERRMARILKNRRTAEESRQRRLQRLKDLEALNNSANERESKLRWEITELREELAARMAEVNRLTEDNEKLRKENDELKGGSEHGTGAD